MMQRRSCHIFAKYISEGSFRTMLMCCLEKSIILQSYKKTRCVLLSFFLLILILSFFLVLLIGCSQCSCGYRKKKEHRIKHHSASFYLSYRRQLVRKSKSFVYNTRSLTFYQVLPHSLKFSYIFVEKKQSIYREKKSGKVFFDIQVIGVEKVLLCTRVKWKIPLLCQRCKEIL